MKRWILVSSAALVLSAVAAACGGGSDGSSHDGMGMGGSTQTTMTSGSSSSAASAEFNAADVTFAQGMIPHHRQAVAMSEMAASQATSPEVKDLAAQIKDAQDPEIATLTAWLEAWGQPVDMPGMGSMSMDGMMSDSQISDMKGASGAEFDKMFLTMMIEHHKGAIVMANAEISDGKNPEAIALAKMIVEAQQAEIATMQALLARQ